MKGSKGTYIFIGVVLLAGIFLVVWFTNREQRYNWTETYENEGEQPYDLSIFTELFADFFPDQKFEVINNLSLDTAYSAAAGANLVYIDGRVYIDSTEANRLMAFAEKGNTVFISASNPHILLERIADRCGTPPSGKWLQTRKAKRIKPYTAWNGDTSKAVIHYQVMDDLVRYPWTYFDVQMCESATVEKAGGFEAIENDYINYISAEVGEGRVLLHSSPLIFSNYHLIDDAVLAHVEDVLSILPEGDTYFLDPVFDTAPPPNRPLLTESPLRFILGNEALRWAWYLVLLLSLVYVLNTVRRNQRVLPVMVRPENDALNFLDVMSRFYRKEGNHKHIAGLQMKMLTAHLRAAYRISRSFPEKGFYEEVQEKMQIPVETSDALFQNLHRASHNSSLTDRELIEIDRKITEFYAKCP
ncbi:MAG: DUF4350 domain-containing protein [Cryomorphaceae bacterium]